MVQSRERRKRIEKVTLGMERAEQKGAKGGAKWKWNWEGRSER